MYWKFYNLFKIDWGKPIRNMGEVWKKVLHKAKDEI